MLRRPAAWHRSHQFAKVEDRWTKTVRDPQGNKQTAPSADHGRGLRWRARYVDDEGRQHAKSFVRKADANLARQRGHTRAGHRKLRPPDASSDRGRGVCVMDSGAGHIAAKLRYRQGVGPASLSRFQAFEKSLSSCRRASRTDQPARPALASNSSKAVCMHWAYVAGSGSASRSAVALIDKVPL